MSCQSPIIMRSGDHSEYCECRECRGNAPTNNGYDYVHQAWVRDGRYVRCGHPASMNCTCYGRLHAGEPVAADAEVH